MEWLSKLGGLLATEPYRLVFALVVILAFVGANAAYLVWVERTGARQAREAEMLEMAADTEANSRLACQIKVGDHLDGLVVRMPQSQH